MTQRSNRLKDDMGARGTPTPGPGDLAPVVPVYKTEADAFVGEKLALASLHFLREWVPALGPTASVVLLELRGEVLAGAATGGSAPVCEISQDELARRLGCDPKTVRRALNRLVGHRLIEIEPQRRFSPRLGHRIVATNRYLVAMYDPPVPGEGGEGAVLGSQAERLMRGQRLLPGGE